MAEKQHQPAQFTPRFRTDIYPYIYPSKFRGSLKGQVAIITGTHSIQPLLTVLPFPIASFLPGRIPTPILMPNLVLTLEYQVRLAS